VMVGFTTLALWLLAQAGTATTVKEEVSSDVAAAKSSRLVDLTTKPPYVNGLEIDPKTQDFLLTTNRGFWRIGRESGKVTPIHSTIAYHGKTDTVGTFLLAKPVSGQRIIGSGHPDHKGALPQFLGYIESDDGGRTWRAMARMGNADLHKIVFAGRRMFAYDAVLSAILTSDNGGRSFTEHFTPRGLIIDFVVDPADPDRILADTDEKVFRSTDGGDGWHPLLSAKRMRMAWPAPGFLYRADQDGTIYTSPDKGDTWKRISKVAGEPYKFKETRDPRHLYLALSDATIVETTDGAKTWKVVFRP